MFMRNSSYDGPIYHSIYRDLGVGITPSAKLAGKSMVVDPKIDSRNEVPPGSMEVG